MNQNRILVCGSLAYDYIMGFSGDLNYNLTSDKEKQIFNLATMPETKKMHFGGTSGNIGYNLANLQANAYLLTAVGQDFIDLGYQKRIEDLKSVEFIGDIHSDLFTASCYIVNDCNHNQMIVFHQGAMVKCIDINIKQKSGKRDPVGIATVSPDFYPAMVTWGEQLHDQGIPFILDPGQVTPAFTAEDLLKLIPKAKLLIGNEFEIQMICEKLDRSIEGVIALNPNLIITKGEHGVDLYHKGEFTNVPACQPAKIIDTTGAGDGFRAGLLTGLSKGLDLVQSSKIGNAVGSFVVETSGAQTQQYSRETISERIQKNYNEAITL